MSKALQRNSRGALMRAASGAVLTVNDDGSCCCGSTDCYACIAPAVAVPCRVWPKISATISGISVSTSRVYNGNGTNWMDPSLGGVNTTVCLDSGNADGCTLFYSLGPTIGTGEEENESGVQRHLDFGLVITFFCDGTVSAYISREGNGGVADDVWSVFYGTGTWTPCNQGGGITFNNENVGPLGSEHDGIVSVGLGGTVVINGQC